MPATREMHGSEDAAVDQSKEDRIRALNAHEAPESPRQGGRRAAGQDPAKRQKILDGAKRCFLSVGFEAASMNEITAEAGVSKGTIYVYFADKEELFAELIDRERGNMLISAQQLLEHSGSIECVPRVLRETLLCVGTFLLAADHCTGPVFVSALAFGGRPRRLGCGAAPFVSTAA